MEEKIPVDMIAIAGDNIVSALGFTAVDNYRSVKSGASGVKRYEGLYGVPEPFMASLIHQDALDEKFAALNPHGEYSPLERAAILSASAALLSAGVDAAHPRTVFIFSSTKGNIEYLDAGMADERLYLWRSAGRIASFFGNANPPVVVSNACISGAYALLTARREILSGRYDCAVVTGADRLSKFIVSGFQSFKAVSGNICKPFDGTRAEWRGRGSALGHGNCQSRRLSMASGTEGVLARLVGLHVREWCEG